MDQPQDTLQVLPFATIRHQSASGLVLSEYAYDLAGDAVMEQRVSIPDIPMGITLANIPKVWRPCPSIQNFELCGFRFDWTDPAKFATNVAAFAGTEDIIRPDTQVWCYSMRAVGMGCFKTLLDKDEDSRAYFLNLKDTIMEYFIAWALEQPRPKEAVPFLRVSWNYALDPSVVSEELYARYLAMHGLAQVGLGTLVERKATDYGFKSVKPLKAFAERSKPIEMNGLTLPFILLDEDPFCTTEFALSLVTSNGKPVHERHALGPGLKSRESVLAMAAEAALKAWGRVATLLIWRRPRGPDARAWDRPTRKDPPAHVSIVTDWVVEGIHPCRDVAKMRDLVQVATALMAETRAPLKECAHHVINMRLKNKSEGRAKNLVDSWFAQELLKNGLVYVPWVGYKGADDEAPHKKKSTFQPGKRKVRTDHAQLGHQEDACDGFSVTALKRRMTSSDGGVTRDLIYVNSSEPVSPITDSNDSMDVDQEGGGEGGDIAPITPGVFWPSLLQDMQESEEDEVIVELDFRSFYPTLHIQYNLCPSRPGDASGARLPTVQALVDLIERRVQAKKDGNKALDIALKSLLVCIYGIPGFQKSCFFSPWIRSEAARRGRQRIQELREQLITCYGAVVLQSITDSVVCKIHRGLLRKFMLESPYYAPMETSGTWIRLADPVYIKAYWAINKNARVWCLKDQDLVTLDTCRGVYPTFHAAHPLGAEAFMDVADALMDPQKTSDELFACLREALAKCPGSVAQLLLRHLTKFCRLSIEKRWPGFLDMARPLLKEHALENELEKELALTRPVEPDPFPLVDRFVLLRIDQYLPEITSC